MTPTPAAFSLVGLLPIIHRWKYWLAGALALAFVVSVIVALLLPNVYKSTAVFIASAPQTTNPERVLGSDEGAAAARLDLSTRAEDLDRIMTIGLSQTVADLMIKKFKLYQHYKAGNPGEESADNFVRQEFSSNLDLTHTERDAIELTFFDQDKFLAARLANAMVEAIDSMNQQLTMQNRRRILNLYRYRYEYLDTVFERNRRQLAAARQRSGIFDLEMQGRYLAKEIIETQAALSRAEAGGGDVAGLRRALRDLTTRAGGKPMNMESFSAATDSLQVLTVRVRSLSSRVADSRNLYESNEIAYRGHLSSLYRVQEALPATQKSKPIRWLIVLGSVAVTLALSLVFITLLELYRRVGQSATKQTYA